MLDVVFFDCDSTLSAVEGIDELAREAGVFEEMERLTRAAMEGAVRLEEVYGQRLERVRPGRAALDRLGLTYVERAVPGAAETVQALHAAGSEVHVVSGGLLPAVLVLAGHLGISADRVHAVDLRFDESGAYAGFDESSPLARAGGKSEACRRVLGEVRRGAMVGDGITDAEAVPPCELFVGFGGVVAREPVRRVAGAWVEGPSLLGVLEHLLDAEERPSAAGGGTS